jgi:hypothetical protein
MTSIELNFLIFLAAVAGIIIFYHIIRGAVKSGTKQIVEELRKQREKETV